MIEKINNLMIANSSKLILLVSVFSLITSFFSCIESMEMKTPEEKEREMAFKHKIKTIKMVQTEYRIGVALPEFLAQVRTYNKEGFRTTELNYNDSVRMHSIIHYEYDKNGNLISSTSKGPDGGLIFRETRTYNDKNKRMELIFYLPDGTYKYRNVSTYDKDGNLQQLAWYWPEGLRAINKFTYNRGLKIGDTEYDPKGKFNYKWIFTYDKNGNQTDAIQYYPDSVVSAKINYTYDEQNRLVKQIEYSGLYIRKQTFFTYDSKGLIETKTDVSPFGSVQLKSRYQFEFFIP